MRFVSVFLLIAVAAFAVDGQSLLEQASPFLDEIEKFPVLLQKTRAEVPLRVILEQPEATEFDVLETKIRAELGKKIREQFEANLLYLQSGTSDAGKSLKSLKETLKDIPSKESVQNFLDQINNLADKRETIESAAINSFEETSLVPVTWNAIQERGIKDWWNKIKEWFKGLGSKISDKFKEFKDWAKKVFEKAIDAAKPLIDQIKALAIEFLKQNWDKLTVEIVKQALSFFHPYLGQLGAEITQMLIDLARHFNLIPWEKMVSLLFK